MARLLGQLRCGGCRHVFWPDRDQATAPFVPCPDCGALHTNPTADTQAELPVHCADPKLLEWLRAFWIGPLPRPGGFSGPFDGLRRVELMEIRGFSCCATWQEHVGTEGQRTRYVVLFLAAKLTKAARSVRDDSLWAPGGTATVVRRSASVADARQALERLVRLAERTGGRPTRRLEEVEDPTPLARAEVVVERDEAAEQTLESTEVSCASCGAPSHATELTVGVRCPYCASQVILPPALDRALRAYHNRVAAAQRVIRAPTLMNLRNEAWSAQVARGRVPLACVRCGAPNRHRPGAVDETCGSCRAPLIPSASARALGVGASGRLAEAAHRRRGDLRTERALRESARLRARRRHLTVFAVAALTALGALAGALWGFGDNPTFAPYAALGCLGLMGVVSARWIARRLVARRWQPRLAALAEQLGSPPVASPDALGDWARRWWPDRLAPWWLRDGPAYGAMQTVIGGFPVAVAASPQTSFEPLRRRARPFATALLAAALPRDTVYWMAQPEAKAIVRDLEGRGYSVEPRIGGLAARAGGKALGVMRREPDAIMELAYVAFTLARLAHHLRAEPHGDARAL